MKCLSFYKTVSMWKKLYPTNIINQKKYLINQILLLKKEYKLLDAKVNQKI